MKLFLNRRETRIQCGDEIAVIHQRYTMLPIRSQQIFFMRRGRILLIDLEDKKCPGKQSKIEIEDPELPDEINTPQTEQLIRKFIPEELRLSYRPGAQTANCNSGVFVILPN